MKNTIVALSSGAIKSAIALIRMSGPDSFNILKNIFSNKQDYQANKIYFGYIKDKEEVVDEVLVSTFLAPHSFTGEDMVEISCHGNLYIVSKIIELCLSFGAKMAERGEFSKRAFINGKIDLVEAESINDLINANNKQAIKLALNGLKGNTSKYVEKLSADLLDLISQIEVNIDYPEYDEVEELTHLSVLPKLIEMENTLNQVIKDTQKGYLIKEGLNTVILGKPNVGKSSLLNALLKQDKAIVTDIAGTTRDLVEGKIDLNGITLNLIDTAGVHEVNDKIEKIGIDKTLNVLKDAHLVLLVLDNSKNLTDEDNYLLDLTKNYNRIIVFNKNDLNSLNQFPDSVNISALNHDLKQLEDKIKEKFKDLDYNDEPLLFNARQLGLLKNALNNVIQAKQQASKGQVIDIIAIDIQSAYKNILEILGQSSNLNLLDNIFSKFCLGK